jgi:hypothetical protein
MGCTSQQQFLLLPHPVPRDALLLSDVMNVK